MHGKYMEIALAEALEAAKEGEIPVGAVIVKDGEIIASAHNNREATGDATGHAEVLAIRKACVALGGWHLEKCTLYVTLEPCPMCMGAIINSRLGKVVFGAKDAKAGACGSVIDLRSYPLNHKPQVESGFMSEESLALLSGFFKEKREKR
ncbi:MAG: tRNA adenosine(34) deaminase TadA [Clostridia bacterium]|nr:tRNA adenosine(34) deaminase TadA [Clostridia bacterium]